ncbi:chaplin [Streptomyces sp. NPDC005925]|uniref:chaplin n=1 Tax=Streptomyces sp. NPDC005925 TaxID=3157172 RepID=UPI0033C71CEF
MRNRVMAAVGLASAALLACAGTASADDGPVVGIATHSPGVLSGNVIQIPIEVQANVCGNTINVIGLLNPAFGNICVNR